MMNFNEKMSSESRDLEMKTSSESHPNYQMSVGEFLGSQNRRQKKVTSSGPSGPSEFIGSSGNGIPWIGGTSGTPKKTIVPIPTPSGAKMTSSWLTPPPRTPQLVKLLEKGFLKPTSSSPWSSGAARAREVLNPTSSTPWSSGAPRARDVLNPTSSAPWSSEAARARDVLKPTSSAAMFRRSWNNATSSSEAPKYYKVRQWTRRKPQAPTPEVQTNIQNPTSSGPQRSQYSAEKLSSESSDLIGRGGTMEFRRRWNDQMTSSASWTPWLLGAPRASEVTYGPKEFLRVFSLDKHPIDIPRLQNRLQAFMKTHHVLITTIGQGVLSKGQASMRRRLTEQKPFESLSPVLKVDFLKLDQFMSWTDEFRLKFLKERAPKPKVRQFVTPNSNSIPKSPATMTPAQIHFTMAFMNAVYPLEQMMVKKNRFAPY